MVCELVLNFFNPYSKSYYELIIDILINILLYGEKVEANYHTSGYLGVSIFRFWPFCYKTE